MRRLGYSITMLGREDSNVMERWESAFVFYWGLSVQYIAPALLWFMFVFNLQVDLDENYGDYSNGMQITGMLVPVLGLLALLLPMLLFVYEVPLKETDFNDPIMVEADEKADEGEVEMSDLATNKNTLLTSGGPQESVKAPVDDKMGGEELEAGATATPLDKKE